MWPLNRRISWSRADRRPDLICVNKLFVRRLMLLVFELCSFGIWHSRIWSISLDKVRCTASKVRAENGFSSYIVHAIENRTVIRNLFWATQKILPSLRYHHNAGRYQKDWVFIAPTRVEFSKSHYDLENCNTHILIQRVKLNQDQVWKPLLIQTMLHHGGREKMTKTKIRIFATLSSFSR